MSNLWLKEFEWPATDAIVVDISKAQLEFWRSVDGSIGRACLSAAVTPGADWDLLMALKSLEGASIGADAAFHYVVETDVAPEHERELDA